MTNHIDMINNTITIGLAEWAAIVMIAVMSLIFMVLWISVAFRMRQLVDRYRLRYGFTRDIERKEISNVTEDKLNNKEKWFKRRTLTD